MGLGGTRIEAVMAVVRARIAARGYLPGMRLPSVRAQARAMGFSVSTVVEAYERLAVEGAIRARPGSGFYVCGPLAPLALSEIGPRLDRSVDPLWISRQALEAPPAMLKPGCGWLPASWLYEDGMRRALRAVARADAEVLADYATPLGLPALRQFLARRMAGMGIEASPEQIMLAESGTQAIDLVCRFLLEPGDTVLVDDPCYFNFHALLRTHRVQAVGVPFTRNGPDLAAFEAALRAHSPRLYITNSGIHNPTGAVLSPVTAHRLLQLAEAGGHVRLVPPARRGQRHGGRPCVPRGRGGDGPRQRLQPVARGQRLSALQRRADGRPPGVRRPGAGLAPRAVARDVPFRFAAVPPGFRFDR
jgi:DNA-binding transcriptional MocR family regulator